MKRITRVVALLLPGLLLGCGQEQPGANAPAGDSATVVHQQITGTISYRERLLPKPDAVVEVSLLDNSRADAPAALLAAQVIVGPGAPPIPFSLDYDAASIRENLSYVVRATIRQDGQLLMTTDSAYPVLTRGAGDHADLLLVSVPGKPAPGNDAVPDAPLANTYWKLVEIFGHPYSHDSDEREPHLKLDVASDSVSGQTGCNSFTGSYAVDGSALSFGPLATTRKMCLKGMETEAQYLQALQDVTGFQVRGDSLALRAGEVTALRFEAVYF